jgi:hypothetical protein
LSVVGRKVGTAAQLVQLQDERTNDIVPPVATSDPLLACLTWERNDLTTEQKRLHRRVVEDESR